MLYVDCKQPSKGNNMDWNQDSKKEGATFTATCHPGHFFVRFSKKYSSKSATCMNSWLYGEYWKYDDGTFGDDVGDCEESEGL